MAALLARNFGLELPIYDWDSINTWSEMVAVTAIDESFLRRIRLTHHLLDILDQHGLKEVLKIADTEFEAVAKYCGASVVPHSWGLAKVPERYTEYIPTGAESEPMPIAGHVLVAEVAAVQPQPHPNRLANTQAIREGLQKYSTVNREYRYADLKVDQFMYGSTLGSAATNWLVDIDLFITPEL